MKIILVGYMASGKSVTGALLAQKFAVPFLDLDVLIEKQEQQSISAIFEKKGEIYFRKTEHQLFVRLMKSTDSFVLSLGGGTPCYAGNDQWLNGDSVVSFYLQTPLDILCKRLMVNQDTRPLLANKNSSEIQDFVAQHLFERSYFYHKASHVIATGDRSVAEIVAEIEKYLV